MEPFFTEEFHAKTHVGSALVFSALFFGVWMLGVFMGDQHTPSKAIHVVGAVVAGAGFIGTFFFAWLAYQAWKAHSRQG
jgi:hypothetical protein